jgi:hypothetical protein
MPKDVAAEGVYPRRLFSGKGKVSKMVEMDGW